MKDEWDFSVLVLQFIGICNHFKIKKKFLKRGKCVMVLRFLNIS